MMEPRELFKESYALCRLPLRNSGRRVTVETERQHLSGKLAVVYAAPFECEGSMTHTAVWISTSGFPKRSERLSAFQV
jgi:hypothetical protein